jgi:hypothetical protein
MLWAMGFAFQRFISTLTAVIVLMASLNCVCYAGTASAAHDRSGSIASRAHQAHKAMPCCQGEMNDPSCPQEPMPCHDDGSNGHHPACNHCQSSLVADFASHRTLDHSFDLTLFAPVATPSAIDLLSPAFVDPIHFPGDLPPPVDRPTLLSLGCALNI